MHLEEEKTLKSKDGLPHSQMKILIFMPNCLAKEINSICSLQIFQPVHERYYQTLTFEEVFDSKIKRKKKKKLKTNI